MKAIILNAGKGGRLAPYTDNNHKALLDIGGKKIIDFQISALQKAGIKEIVIVVGYLKEKIQNYVSKYTELKFTFIENKEYQTTNTAYSLYLVKEQMNEDFIYLNGDVLFTEELTFRLVNHKAKNVLAVEKKICGEEEVKVILNKNRITSIGKKISISKSFGEFIGVAKFSKDIYSIFKNSLERTIENEKLYKEYFEYALEKIVKQITLTAINISDIKTIEIDFPEDLERARKLFEEPQNCSEKKKKVLFYVERDLHLPFLEPIFDCLNIAISPISGINKNDFHLAFSAPNYKISENGKVGIGLEVKEINRLKSKSEFYEDPEKFQPDITVVADVSFSLKNCGKIINVGHGIISKGGFYRDSQIVRRENLADLTCVPGEWHKEILEKNVFIPIVVTGFIKSDKMFGANSIKRPNFCKQYKIDENKKIILFAPTFNEELSSIPIIREKIIDLADDDKVLLIKLHSMTDIKYVEMYKELGRINKNVIFIEDLDLTPSLAAADVLISDVSSAAAEFLFLDKPVIIFNNPNIKKYPFYSPDDIEYKIREACTVVNTLTELKSALDKNLKHPEELSDKRQYYTEKLCFGRDGKSAERTAEAIIDLLSGKISKKEKLSRISIFIISNNQKLKKDLVELINQITNTYPKFLTEIFILSNMDSGFDINDLNISGWINTSETKNLSSIIRDIKSDYSVITHDYINHPAYLIERLLNYFRWYPDIEAVNALNNHDDYKQILDKYFPGLDPFDYENIAHKFRHFIGADVENQRVNNECFTVKTEALKKISFDNFDNTVSSFTNIISEELSKKKARIKLSLDVFVSFNKNSNVKKRMKINKFMLKN